MTANIPANIVPPTVRFRSEIFDFIELRIWVSFTIAFIYLSNEFAVFLSRCAVNPSMQQKNGTPW